MSVGYIVKLDPVAAITNRVELDLNSGNLAVDHAGIDWGEAAVSQYLSQQRIGETPVSYRIPNRQISIPLVVGAKQNSSVAEEEATRRKLQQKVALLQRQGGVLLRQRSGGEPLYADIMDATLTLPDVYGERGAVEPSVILKLACLPDFYGEEIELDAVEQLGQIVAILEKAKSAAVIAGDYPARVRIVVSEKGKANQKGLLWGLRSTHYDAASTSALFYDAKDMTPINGAILLTVGGGYSGKWVQMAAPEANTWHPFMTTDLVSGAKPLTHLGSYRVWARVVGSEGGELRLAWSVDDATSSVFNPAVSFTGSGVTDLVDLGEIRLDEPPTGEHWWRGVLQVRATGAGVAIDRIWLQPIDDGAGKMRATAVPSSTLLGPSKPLKTDGQEGTGTGWILFENSAEVTLPGGETEAKSKTILLGKLGFALPVGVTIRGVQVDIIYNLSPFGVNMEAIKMRSATETLPSKILAAVNGGHITIGGPTTLLSAGWTVAQVNAATFGPMFRVAALNPNSTPTRVSLQASMTVRVYYSYSAGAITEDAVLYSERQAQIRFDGALRQDVNTNAYVPVSELTGDLPRLPPSGLENRAVELFVKNSRGLLVPATQDLGIDKVQAQVFYRPCYIGRI